jgi:hypothetical protein
LPEISVAVDFKYGRKWSYVCLFFCLISAFAALSVNFINLCRALYFFVLGCHELGHDFKVNGLNLTEQSDFSSEEVLPPFWTLTGTVPLFCIVVILIVNVQSSVFFSRLLAVFGLPSTIFISCVLFWKASVWRNQQRESNFEPYPVLNFDVFPFATMFYNISYMPIIM